MNELAILLLFYDDMKARGLSRDQVFLSMNEKIIPILQQKYGGIITLADVHKATDICIANEWLERTTIDPGYNFLSLTPAGLQIAIVHQYR